MKEKFNKWFTGNVAVAILYGIFGACMAWCGEWVIAILSLAVALYGIACEAKDRKCNLLKKELERNRNLYIGLISQKDKTIEGLSFAYDRLCAYYDRAYYTVKFCKREIDVSTYLKKLREAEKNIEFFEKEIEKRKQKK